MGTVSHLDFPSLTKKTWSKFMKADFLGNCLQNTRQLERVDTTKLPTESQALLLMSVVSLRIRIGYK